MGQADLGDGDRCFEFDRQCNAMISALVCATFFECFKKKKFPDPYNSFT